MGQCQTQLAACANADGKGLSAAERELMAEFEKQGRERQEREVAAIEANMTDEWRSKAEERLVKGETRLAAKARQSLQGR